MKDSHDETASSFQASGQFQAHLDFGQLIRLSHEKNLFIIIPQIFPVKLCLADAIQNFKWVKIIQISQNEGERF